MVSDAFGLTNAPGTFMRLMDQVLRAYIGSFVVVHFDDMLIYSQSMMDHVEHLRKFLDVLRKETLYANIKTFSFGTYNLGFLGFVVTSQCIHVDTEKAKVIRDRLVPKIIGQVRRFQGLAGFYKRFVNYFSSIAAPLTEIFKKSVGFTWGNEQEKAFQQLKERLSNAPLLVLPNFLKT